LIIADVILILVGLLYFHFDRRLQREVVAAADKHADVLVEAFAARNKALDAIRDLMKEPVRFYRPDGINMTRDCDVPCEEIRREAATPVLYVEK